MLNNGQRNEIELGPGTDLYLVPEGKLYHQEKLK